MKIIARLMGLTTIALLFIGMLMNIMQQNILQRDLIDMTSLAVNQTQIVMKEQIEDKYYNYDNARTYFTSNSEYVDYFKNVFKRLITSDAKYTATIYDVDYEKGLISVGVDCTYKNIVGAEKTLHTRKTSIVDVIIEGSGTDIPEQEDKKATIITKPTVATGSEYDGNDKVLCTSAVVSGGNVYYGYATESGKTPTNYTTSLPQAKNAGTYYVWYKIKNNTTQKWEQESFVGSVSITPRVVTLTWGDDTWTYDGLVHSTSVIVGNKLASDFVDADLENNEITNAGSVTAKVVGVSNSNYKLPSTNLTHTLKVEKRPLTLTVDDASIQYSGTTTFIHQVEGLIDGETLTGTAKYTVKNASGQVVSDISKADVGAYTINLSGLDNSNYNITNNSGALTIKQKTNYLTCSAGTDYYLKLGQTEITKLAFGAASNYQGTLSYSIVSQYKEISRTETKLIDNFSISGTNLVWDELPDEAGTYIIYVKASCTGNANYAPDSKTQQIAVTLVEE